MKKIRIRKMGLVPTLVLIGALILLSGFSNLKIQNLEDEFPRKKIVEYLNKNVAPVMKSYRYEFNKNLSKDEIAQIENIRSELKKIRKTREKAGLDRAKNYLTTELSDSQIDLLKQSRKKAYKSLLRAMLIADDHDAELETILKKEESKRKQWANDIAEIIAENGGKRFWMIKPLVKKNIQHLMPFDNIISVMFVLWNPDEPLFDK